MGRKKTGIRRIRKKDLRHDIEEMFQQNPTTAYEQRTICRNFSLTTPPARQLVADILQDLLLEDYIRESPRYCYQLKPTAKTPTCPTRAENPSSWPSATRCAPWRATACASA